MNLHEYQAKDVFRTYGIPVPTGRVAGTARRLSRRRVALGGSLWVVQGAGARGRPRQGRRREGRTRRRGGAPLLLRHARHAPGHYRRPDPKACPSARCTSRPARRSHARSYLSLTLNRERGRIAPDRLGCRRHGHRGGGSTRPRRRSSQRRSTRRRACRPTRRASSPLAWASAARRPPNSRVLAAALYRLYMEKDLSLLEVNPLIVTQGRLAHGTGRQDQRGCQCGLPPPGTCRAARCLAGGSDGAACERARPQLRIPRRGHRLQWSMAPALPWPPWT